MRYIITYDTQLDNGYVDTRQILLSNRQNANIMYRKLFKSPAIIRIKLEAYLWQILSTGFLLIIKVK